MQKMNGESRDQLIFYSEYNLRYLAHEQIWRGTGTETNPFVIQNANILGQEILINNSSLYISFINCNFDHAQFENCQNIILENCTFRKLVLNKCYNFNVNENIISDLSFSRTKKIYFRNSVIIEVSTKIRIKNIYFENCQLNDGFFNSIITKIYSRGYSKYKELISSMIIIFSSLILTNLFYTYYIFNSLDVINLKLIICLIFLIIFSLSFSLLYDCIIKKRRPKIIIK